MDADKLGAVVPVAAAAPQTPFEPATAEQKILAIYKAMLASLFISTLLFCLAISVLVLVPFLITKGEPSIALTVVLVGALGAFFSALIRLYNFEDLPKIFVAAPLKEMAGKHLLIYSLVPALIGAISAIVIYLVFAGAILQGPLFPTFVCKPLGGCNSFLGFIDGLGPEKGADYAKVLVWAFAAGFAERLVPDTLGRFTQSLQKAKGLAAESEEQPKKADEKVP